MTPVNERLAEAAIAHAIDLDRYGTGVVRRLIGLLNKVDKDLFEQITIALMRLPAESFTVERLEGLLMSSQALNKQAYDSIGRELSTELRSLVEYEIGYQNQLFTSVLPAQVSFATVSADQVYAAAMSRPFQGKLLSEWASKIEVDKMGRIRDAIRIGYVEGQTTSQIMQRIRGTQARGYEDAIIETDRRSLRAVVQTALSHTAGSARDGFYESNGDILKSVKWSSTIDGKTTPDCRLRDGLTYTPVEHKPIGHSIPWRSGPGKIHWCCRSSAIPIVKSFNELFGINVDETQFPKGTRASLDGQIPAGTTYAEWIKRQSAARQDDILGPTRGKLMREGGLTLDRYYTDKGRYLTLDELRTRDAAAFSRAGL
jgi:hypothetical protein